MLNFDNFFRNHFDNVEISDDELNQYSMEHVQLLAPLSQYGGLVTATMTAYDGYFGAISNEAIKANIQKSLTAAMNGTFEEFKSLVSQHEGAVRSTWGEGTPNYLRFYPLGITEYRNANLENIDEKMTRYEQALTDLGSNLPQAVVDAFVLPAGPGVTEGVILRFRSARAAQLAAKGETAAGKSAAHTSRDVLEIQLMRNLFTVALDAVDQDDTQKANLRALFPQHLVKDTPPASGGGTTLDAPTLSPLQPGPTNSIVATWSSVTGVVNYIVEAQVVGVDPDFVEAGTTADTTLTFGGFSSGATVRVRVRAIGSPGPGGTPESPNSNVEEITFA